MPPAPHPPCLAFPPIINYRQATTSARDKAQRDIAALQATLAQETELFEAELQATMDMVNSAATARRQQRNMRDANGGVAPHPGAGGARASLSLDMSGRPSSALSRWGHGVVRGWEGRRG